LGHSGLPPAERSGDQLSTLTLAQIYESQGYLQKALTIYERLLQQHPANAQVAQRLDELRRRLSGVDESAHRPESASSWSGAEPRDRGRSVPRIPPDTSSQDKPDAKVAGWRLVDAQSLGALRPAPTRQGEAAAADAPLAESGMAGADAAARRDEDFQRFLRYVRSLGR
jgi:hypothetical protein